MAPKIIVFIGKRVVSSGEMGRDFYNLRSCDAGILQRSTCWEATL